MKIAALLLPLFVFVAAPALPAPAREEIRIALIGDSTVCNYPTNQAMRGWGQLLPERFSESVKFHNVARSGRSTKTFLAEGLWKTTLAFQPDYILIQFGHNDSHGKGRPESTDAATDFPEFLRRYVAEARAAGATPILVTPMHRRVFHADGKVTQELLPYADAMKSVAAAQQVPLLDLHAASGAAFEKLGDTDSTDLSCCGSKDRTHFSEKGARLLAGLVAEGLRAAEPRLAKWLK